jgi:HlyD family secretion protein
VDGVVIKRSVDIGQTVAASLQTPELFTIAQDLRKMQVETDVDEADIGGIRVGQRVIFTVDAFAGKEFTGNVLQVRIAPHSVQNVVTYTVVVSAENPEFQLLPGMTANVSIIIDERADVLKLPNAALRFHPPAAESGTSNGRGYNPSPLQRKASDADRSEERLQRLTEALDLTADQQQQIRAAYAEMRRQIGALRQQGATAEEIRAFVQSRQEINRRALSGILSAQQLQKFQHMKRLRETGTVTPGRVWVMGEGMQPTAVDVKLGISDGQYTELIGGELVEKQQVIVGIKPVSR